SSGRSGYWMLGSDGKVFPFGDAKSMGDASTALPAGSKAMHIEPTPTAAGYWIVNDDGLVYAYGDAQNFGNVNAADSASTRRSRACRPRRPARATGSSPPRVGSSPSATPSRSATWAR